MNISNLLPVNMFMFMTCAAIIIGTSVPFGYGLGSIGGLINIIEEWIRETIYHRFEIELTEEFLRIIWASVVSTYLIGGAIGSFAGSWLSDNIGRRQSILIILILFVIGSIMCLICPFVGLVELLFLGRLSSGLASGLSTSIIPMYLSEIATLHLRGSLAALFSVGLAFGIFCGNVSNMEEVFSTETLWNYGLAFSGIFSLLSLLVYPSFPESPKYLYIIKKKKEKTINVLTLLHGSNTAVIEEEMSLMEKEASIQAESRSMLSVLKDPALRLPLFLTCFIQIGQQLSGITAVAFYIIPMFETIGLTPTYSRWSNAALGFSSFLMASSTPFTMAKINRRPMMITSCFVLIVALILMSIGLTNAGAWTTVVSVIGSFLFLWTYQIGIGSMAYFIGSELFEVAPRSAAMALGSICSWTFNFGSAMVFPIFSLIAGPFAMLPFIVAIFVLAIFLLFYLPETRNQDPTDVALKIAHGFRSKPLSQHYNTKPINS